MTPGTWNTIHCSTSEDRLDAYLAKQTKLSRSRIQKLIEQGNVRCNGEKTKASTPLETGDTIEIFLPEAKPLELKSQNIPLKILFQDEHIAVIVKPAGLVVHPSAGHSDGTLVNALLHHLGDLSHSGGIGGELRPGIVHRIDRNTSGILLVTKSDIAHQNMAQQFKEHTITRKYQGLCWGTLPEKGEWNLPIGRDPKERKRMAAVPTGKTALTKFKRISTFFAAFTHFEAELFTGRTHQIRVHFSHHGFPLLGDAKYTVTRSARRQRDEGMKNLKKHPDTQSYIHQIMQQERQALHASHLGFHHPTSGKKMQFDEPLPTDLQNILSSAFI